MASPLFPYDTGVNGKNLSDDLAEFGPEKYTPVSHAEYALMQEHR